MYYVGFSSCTILASLILFQGFYDTTGPNTVSLFVGFIVIFLGVHLLEHSRSPEVAHPNQHSALESGLMNPRLSIGGRMSLDGWSPVSPAGNVPLHGVGGRAANGHGRRTSRGSRGQVLFNAFEDELPPASANLGRLPEEDDDDDDDDDADERTRLRSKPPTPSARSPRPSPGMQRGNSFGR
jgi:magnesium transporter